MHRLSPAAAPIALTSGVILLLALVFYWPEVTAWAAAQQKTLQSELARAVNAVRGGDAGAIAALLGASLFYGLAHAVGPGHGKVLITGAALASRRAAWRMAGIGFSASLAQAMSAILIVYGGLGLLSASGGWTIDAAEGLLAPISFAAMALIGLWIAVRGARLLKRLSDGAAHGAHDHTHDPHHHAHAHGHDHAHGHGCHAGCRHGPTVEEAERIESWRDVVALIASIGVRPCSGALIVLVIAWRFELYVVGALSAVAMAVGTGAIVAGAALIASSFRDVGGLRGDETRDLKRFGWAQIVAGGAIAALSVAMAAGALSVGSPAGGLV